MKVSPDDAGVHNILEKDYKIDSMPKTREGVDLALADVTRHPVREYLQSLVWDGEKRCETVFIDYLGAEDSRYVRTVTRKALIGAAARILSPGCKHDHMLVLVGPQGCRKSTTLKKLGKDWFSDSLYTMTGKDAYEQLHLFLIIENGEMAATWNRKSTTLKKLGKDWFSDSLYTMTGKDAYEQLHLFLIIENGEMAATWNAEIESIKQFVSKQEDNYRAAYARRTQCHPRQCAFFGTTNDEEFLRDPTGALLFWPVVVTDAGKTLGEKLTSAIVDQIWAEVVTYYEAGETWYLDSAVEEMARKVQADHTEANGKLGLIENFLAVPLPEGWDDWDLEKRLKEAIVRRRFAAALLACAAAVPLVLTGAVPADAAPLNPTGSAFVASFGIGSGTWTPQAQFQWNSAHPFGSVNSVTRNGLGSYTVHLPNLGANSGTVLVNALNSTPFTCKVASWGPTGTTQDVAVRCFNVAGQAVDSPFTVSYNNHLDSSDVAYLWANQPTSADYQPAANYQANSTGAVNEVTRSGVGTYQVRLPNLGQFAGHVQVTAYGTGSQRCKTTGWGPNGADQLIGVQCMTVTGSPTDTFFTLTYVRNTNILGNDPVCCSSSGYPSVYAWANDPTAGSYVPASNYQFSNGVSGSISIKRLHRS